MKNLKSFYGFGVSLLTIAFVKKSFSDSWVHIALISHKEQACFKRSHFAQDIFQFYRTTWRIQKHLIDLHSTKNEVSLERFLQQMWPRPYWKTSFSCIVTMIRSSLQSTKTNPLWQQKTPKTNPHQKISLA